MKLPSSTSPMHYACLTKKVLETVDEEHIPALVVPVPQDVYRLLVRFAGTDTHRSSTASNIGFSKGGTASDHGPEGKRHPSDAPRGLDPWKSPAGLDRLPDDASSAEDSGRHGISPAG